MIWWQSNRADNADKPIYVVIGLINPQSDCQSYFEKVMELKLGTYKDNFDIGYGSEKGHIVGIKPGIFWYYQFSKDGN